MLRGLLLALAVIGIAFGAWLVSFDPAGWPALILPCLLVAGIVFERVHYRGSASVDSPDKDWRPTNERFLDEVTGRPVTVWFNPTTGERRYVDE